MAWLRVNWKSPNSPLISLEMRFEVVTYLNEGRPMPTRIPMITMTIATSVTVKPAIRPCWGNVFMGAILRPEPCTKLTEALPELKKNVTHLTQRRCRRQRATLTRRDPAAAAARLLHLTLAEFHPHARSDAVPPPI